MARIRTIKPDFFKNEELADLPAMIRLLFIGLWTQSDREGRLLDRPKRIKAEIFPYDNIDVDKGLNQLFEAGFIIRYKVNANIDDRILAPEQPENETAVIQIVNFLKHQKIDRANEKESELPDYEQGYKKTISSLVIAGERKGKEGKGMEGNGEIFEIVFPFESEKFKKFWQIWKDYKKEQHRESYKSPKSEQAALEKLNKISGGSEEIAIEIIKESMSNTWKGLFELKNGTTKAKQSTGSTAENAARVYEMYANAANSKQP